MNKIVRRLKRKIPKSFEWQDLIQAGQIGLLLAARTFDTTRGQSKPWAAEYWARTMIKREVLNAIAKQQWLYATNRRPLDEARCTAVVRAEDAAIATGQAATGQPKAFSPKVWQAMESHLTPRERRTLVLIYDRNLSHREIARGRLTGASSPSTIITDHEKALAKLRAELGRDILPRAA